MPGLLDYIFNLVQYKSVLVEVCEMTITPYLITLMCSSTIIFLSFLMIILKHEENVELQTEL